VQSWGEYLRGILFAADFKSKYSATSFFVLGKLPAGLTENAGIPPLHEGDVKCCP